MQESLAHHLNRECDRQPFETCFYFKSLTDSCVIERNGNKVIPSGSTRKIVIMMRVFAAVQNQELKLTDTVELEPRMQSNEFPGVGMLHLFNPGIPLTIWDLLLFMIMVSDISAASILGNITGGLVALNHYTQEIGMKRTWHAYVNPTSCTRDHPRTLTCARDMANLLDLILRGAEQESVAHFLKVNSRYCQMALFLLSNQRLNQRLPVFLPPGYLVYHKTGTTCETSAMGISEKLKTSGDVGIILDEKRHPLFILAVYRIMFRQ